jgi:hypothetical protein
VPLIVGGNGSMTLASPAQALKDSIREPLTIAVPLIQSGSRVWCNE